MSTTEKRGIFDWIVWSFIHVVLIGAIGYAGFAIYGEKLGAWVAASAFIAGMVSLYLFAKIVPGETLMKIVLYLAAAANAGYLVHNGAKAMGVEAYNTAQVAKYEAAMSAAAQSSTRGVARTIGLSAKDATALERIFDDGVSVTAAILAFLELAIGMMIFAIASRRVAKIENASPAPSPSEFPSELEVEK